jgi:hypothetical protein
MICRVPPGPAPAARRFAFQPCSGGGTTCSVHQPPTQFVGGLCFFDSGATVKMASVYRYRKTGPYYLNWRENGKHRVRSLHTTDLQEALKAKAEEERTHVTPPRRGIQWGKIDLAENPRSPETMRKRFTVLAGYAQHVLSAEPQRFAFLLCPPKPTLLAYLGRVGDPEVTRKIADHLCSAKLTVAKGRSFIAQATRRARPAPPLHVAIERAVEQWATLHPREFLATNIAETLAALSIDYRDLARQKQQIAA